MTTEQPFFKGITGFTRSNDDLLMEAAEDSVYYWWWAFMRLSPVFWYARETGLPLVEPQIAQTYAAVGTLRSPSFEGWWSQRGKYLFAEERRPAKVRLVDVDNIPEHELYKKSVLVEIPLTIRRQTILKQFKNLLEEVHEGRRLDLAKTSTAQLRLHTKKFNLRTLENEYWAYLYRLLYPEITVWRIGDRLKIAPALKVDGIDRREAAFRNGSGPFDKLNSLTGRYLYKAKFTRLHAELGSFPNYTSIENPATSMPFGPKHHDDFMHATYEGKLTDAIKTPSAWQAWLHDEHAKDLKYRVLRVNHIDKEYISRPSVRERLPLYISGAIDTGQLLGVGK